MSRWWIAMSCLCAGAAAAQPWTPSPCGREFEKSWAAYERALREAKPGSPLYVPNPFPMTKEEVIENFEHRFTYTWEDEPLEKIPEWERPLIAGLRQGTLTYEMDRVEHWTPSRCQSKRQAEFYFLLRIRDRPGGPIIARASIGQNGHWSEATMRPIEERLRAFWDPAVPTLGEALTKVREDYGIEGKRVQYVSTWGKPRCASVVPCVAMQANGRSYLLARDELFEWGPGSPEHPHSEVRLDRGASVEARLGPDEGLMSIGAHRWVVARKVPRRQ